MTFSINKYLNKVYTFEAHHVPGAEVLWVDEQYGRLQNDELIDKYCYVNKNSLCFSDIEFNEENHVDLEIEQYGGGGLGLNAGGVRCGNFSDVQVKGTGINQTIGMNAAFTHSNGIFNLEEAYTEALNTRLLNACLPAGVVDIHAIISLGKSRFNKEDGVEHNLAIALRELCLRPGHFLGAPNPKIRRENRGLVMADAPRVKQLNIKLKTALGGEKGVLDYVANFINVSAMQFAFGKIFRIYHGGVSPTNLSFDGRWLDVTNSTFINGAVNYSASDDTAPFLYEPYVVADTIEQFMYTNAKYTGSQFHRGYFANMFINGLDHYLGFVIRSLFGVDPASPNFTRGSIQTNQLVREYDQLLSRRKNEYVGSFPENENFSVVESFVVDKFLSLFRESNTLAEKEIKKLLLRNESVGNRLSDTDYKKLTGDLVRSLRKLYLPLLVSKRRVKQFVVKMVEAEGSFGETSDFLVALLETAFDRNDSDTEVLMFSSENYELVFSIKKSEFVVRSQGVERIVDRNDFSREVDLLAKEAPPTIDAQSVAEVMNMFFSQLNRCLDSFPPRADF